ncbi:uncharacterized protein METZ01_LOCUS255553, partial [marine metagenome]
IQQFGRLIHSVFRTFGIDLQYFRKKTSEKMVSAHTLLLI